MSARENIFGLIAEFSDEKEVLAATKSAYEKGFRRMDAFTPFPVDGLAEALGRHRTGIPLIVLLAGVAGGVSGYFMQWFAMAVDYPLNVGGRPFHSWPMFVPITFELTILCAALAAFIAMLALNKLPQPYHPVFNVPEFARASTDKFFLCIEASDPHFHLETTRRFLESLAAQTVTEVAA